uniref:Polycystin 1 like 2/pseudo n=1 Tax=Callorhinchus milii TaxID=7868 RepID=A0A4W3IMU0_CALMI
MCLEGFFLLIFALSLGGGSEAEPCFEQQLAFQDACYEAVKLQRTFRSAQGWCERGGGHLAFILRQETQEFLQKSLAAGRDWWIGRNCGGGGGNKKYGTKLSYSNWSPAHRLPATAECAFIAKNSAYHWLSTPNCSQELYFICEFESGRTLACDHVNATLQCESGKVIQIDNSFYGRKTLSYCSSETASPPETQECGWVDVREQVAGDCHGLQVCQASADPTSFGDPCPSLGSYLVVEYHCKEGLRLLVDDLYSLLENVTISQQWLLHPYSGNLTCTLSTGDVLPDGEVVTHRYRAAGLFTISIECSTSEWNVAAQKTISIQEPIGDLGTLKCANGNQSADVNNCRALYGEPLWIQLEVEEAGTAVLHTCTVLSGNIPQNVTIESAAQHLIGPGTHQLKILAKNNVTIREVSQNITVDLVEPIVGLEAVLNSAVLELGKDLTVNISVSLGAPIQLQFEFIGPNGTFSETIESPDGKLGAYSIPMNSEGNNFLLFFPAVNAFSSMSFNAGNITVKANSSILIERDVDDAIDEGLCWPLWSTCVQDNQIEDTQQDLIISPSCLPPPFSLVSIKLTTKIPLAQMESADNCSYLVLCFRCESNCKPLNSSEDTLLKVTCSECTTSLTYNWYRVSTSNQEVRSFSYLNTPNKTDRIWLLFLPLFIQYLCFFLFLQMNRHSACVSQKQNGVLKIFTLMKENTNVYRDHTISMVPPPPVASCAISPEEGSTVTTTFSINCKVNCNSDQPCSLSDLKYCFYVKPNIALHCGSESILSSVYLPHGDSDNSDQLTITVIVSNSADTFTSVTVNATVIFSTLFSSCNDVFPQASESFQTTQTSTHKYCKLFFHFNVFQTFIRLCLLPGTVNPFTWANKSEVSGTVGGLTLTLVNGTVQPINELSEDIEIILPRLEVAHENQTELKLRGNQVVVKVNVTSENATLLLHLEPEQDISLLLYLGFESEANETSPHRSTQLPYVQYAGAARYTWILPPTDLTYGIGTYYITVQPDLNSSDVHNMTLAFTSFATQCVYWDEISSNWSTSGCRVGPLTTPTSTQCLCNHLTFFSSSFFVMPNTVDVSKTLELFATFSNNPVVVMTVACIFALYLLAVIWARRKDQQDVAKVKMTVLADNDPFAQYRYLVTVYTGHRRGAFTTAEVTITLYGSEGESDPHHLTDSEKPVFESGGVDVFLLATLFPLGDLQSIRMWHDNSGSSPAWYVNRVTVHDLETDQRWCFLCNSWLAIDVGECLLDKTFSVATETDLKRFSNLFFMKTAKDFRDGHIWYSVFSCPPRSSFTRVQRVSCCFSLLLCTMLTSIIFWGIPKDPAQQKMDLGKIEFTWQEVVIGFESSLLMFPINLLIVQIFRNIRPKSKGKETQRKQGKHGRISPSSSTPSSSPPSCSLTPEADIQRIANSLTKTLKNPLPTFEKDCIKTTDINILLALVEKIICEQNKTDREFYNENHKKAETLILSLGSVNLQGECESFGRGLNEKQRRSDHNHYLYLQLQHVEKELEYLGPASFQSPHSYTQAVCQVHNMKDFLESTIPCSNSGVCAKGLPWWFVFVGWFLVAATSGVSAFFTMLYGLSYGKDNSIKWLISMSISFFESLLITQPLKVLGFAAFFALVLKKVDEEEVEDGPINNSLSTTVGDPSALLATRRDSSSSVYQPPPPNDVEKMKKDSIKEQKVFGLIREILAYLGFLWMLLLVAYGQRDPNSYYLNKAIGNSFSHGFGDVLSYSDFFKWANNTLISNLFGSYPGFVTDGNSNLVGSARIRQLRVKRSSCPVPAKLRNSMTECHTQYSLSNEDLSDYGLHWNTSASQNSSDLDSVWQYQSQSELRSFPIWGKLAMYRGGGYIAELGTDAQDAYRILQYLFQNTWLDIYTRSIFVEFTVYNANVNLFCIATLVLESNAVGAFFTHIDLKSVRLYQYTDGLHIFVIAAEVAYFLFLIYYMVIQGKLLKAQKWGYFKSKWNLLEMAIIMISWSAFSVFIKRTLLGKRDIDHYHNHREGFVSFYETAMADAVMGYLIAFLVLLATVKLWHLLRLNPKLNMITSTIRRAWGDISGFLTVMIIMFVAYSIATNLMFGWSMSSYKTILDAAETMVSLQLGIFNYEEVLDYSPILGSFLIGSCIIFMTFVVLNLFISVILVAFSEEQKNYKASEEEEIVDLMLMKLFSFFGIKYSKDTCQSGG